MPSTKACSYLAPLQGFPSEAKLALITKNGFFLKSLKVALDRHGLKLDGFYSYKKVVQWMSKYPHHCLLLEISLLPKDGLSFIKSLRSHQTAANGHRGKLLAIIEHEDPNLCRQLLQAGIDDIAVKSLDLSLLLLRINLLLQKTSNVKPATSLGQSANSSYTCPTSASNLGIFSYLSHELKTPVSSMLGAISLLQASACNPEQLDLWQSLSLAAQHVHNLIHSVLDFSRLQAGKLIFEVQEFNLSNSLADLSQLFAPEARQKGIELAIMVSPMVPSLLIGDEVKLKQILINLLGNALKFTPQGGLVLLRVEPIKERGQDLILRFEVLDTGIGIANDSQLQLFQPFQQIKASHPHPPGTGLGLVIAKQLVELLQGKLYLKSKEGKGSLFGFTTTLALAPGRTYVHRKMFQHHKMAFLLKHPHFAAHWQRYLRSWPIVAYPCRTEQELWSLFQSSAPGPDLLLLDEGLEALGLAITEYCLRQGRSAPRLLCLKESERSLASPKDRIYAATLASLAKPVIAHQLMASFANLLWPKNAPPLSLLAPSLLSHLPVGTGQRVQGKRILLVEDNHLSQKVASKMIETCGYEAVICEGAHMAIEAFKKQQPQLILMDYHIPDGDGVAVAKAIRQIEIEGNLPHTPIIALTADNCENRRKDCLEAKMDDFVPKPLTLNQMRQTLADWLEKPSSLAKK